MNSIFKLAAISLTFALTACGGGGGDDDSSGDRTASIPISSANIEGALSCNIPDFAQALGAALNKARSQSRNCGAVAMSATNPIEYWNTQLTSAAARHSSDMASKGFFSHTGSDNSLGHERTSQAGYNGWAGENIARGASLSTAESVVQAWLNSPGHCQSIMNPDSKQIGAACVASGDPFKKYWTLILGG